MAIKKTNADRGRTVRSAVGGGKPPASFAERDDAKDAARYRWLRDPANAEVAELLFIDSNEDGPTDAYYQHYGDSLDGEIDARIREKESA